MNISYRWLRELAPTITDDAERIAERLGMLGAPVDEFSPVGAELGDIVIARVDEVSQHPNADRLRVCTVDAGGGERLQVVCGAPNVVAGGFYPFAPVGATLPGGMVIRKAKLRGEASQGMLCSARELGLGRDHAGLLALSGEWTPGVSFVQSLALDDTRLLLDITPNRPDLLSHLGVARELAPGGDGDIRLDPFSGRAEPLEITGSGADGTTGGVEISIEDEEGCPRYCAAVMRGVKVAPSPEWLASRLRVIGVRPINNVVDATNFVLHELGQPLHAFDLARLGRRVVIRRSGEGEVLRTLDGVDRTLVEGTVVIADARRPVALAGVMGGEDTEVGDETTDLLIECAWFDPGAVRTSARRFGLSTDASYRFERGVDRDLQPLALRRVVDLIAAVAGGTAVTPAADLRPVAHAPPVIEVRPSRVERLLGVRIGSEEIAALLEPIRFSVAADSDESVRVTVPGSRPDVTREIDLIEEIARRRGYDSFEERLLPHRPSNAGEDSQVAVTEAVHQLLRRNGFLEARTAGFAPAADNRVPLLNPLSAEESHLRDELLSGLLRRVEHNWAHGVRDIRLYEIGTVFFPDDGEIPAREEIRIAAVATGGRAPHHWTGSAGVWDRWDLKALLSELRALLGDNAVVASNGGAPRSPLLEPADSYAAGVSGAEGGRVRHAVIDPPPWAGQVWALEGVLPERLEPRPVHYRPLPEHPGVDRDLALVGQRSVAAAEMEGVIREAAGPLLESLSLFDVYEGKGIPEGARSLAWRLRFRHAERTLTDAEVDRSIERVLAALEERLDVRRR